MSLERRASFADLALEYEQVAPIHSYSRAFYAYIRVSDASTASSWHDSIERCIYDRYLDSAMLNKSQLYASTPNLRNHGSKTSLKPADRPKEANSLSAVFPWKHIGCRADQNTKHRHFVR